MFSVPRKILAAGLVCFMLLFLTSCGYEHVVYGVSQKEANEIVALLAENGIPARAQKEAGASGSFYVSVNKADYARAVSILSKAGLPRKTQTSINELTNSNGIMPVNKRLLDLRLDYALGAELAEKIRTLRGVRDASVIVRYNTVPTGEISQATAAVILSITNGSNVDKTSIKRLIKLALPGIKDENIFVRYEVVSPKSVKVMYKGVAKDKYGQTVYVPVRKFLYFFVVGRDSVKSLSLLLLGIMVVSFFMGGSIGCLIKRWRKEQ